MDQTSSPDMTKALAPHLRRWVAVCLLNGYAPANIAAKLATHLEDPSQASLEVRRIQDDPIMGAANEVRKKRDKLGSLLTILARHLRYSPLALKIPVETNLTPERFFQEYYFSNRPVIVRGLMKEWPETKMLRRPKEIHLPEELLDYREQVNDLTHFILPDDETGFLGQLRDLNQGLSLVRSAIAHPSTFPKVPELERGDLDVLICCRHIAWGESVDLDLRHYLFLRYPELQEVVILFRERDESRDVKDADAEEEETQP